MEDKKRGYLKTSTTSHPQGFCTLLCNSVGVRRVRRSKSLYQDNLRYQNTHLGHSCHYYFQYTFQKHSLLCNETGIVCMMYYPVHIDKAPKYNFHKGKDTLGLDRIDTTRDIFFLHIPHLLLHRSVAGGHYLNKPTSHILSETPSRH